MKSAIEEVIIAPILWGYYNVECILHGAHDSFFFFVE